MEELKPCPFCGGEARVERDSFSGSFYVGCLNDECLGFAGLGWTYKKEQEAFKAWNTRAYEEKKKMRMYKCDRCGKLVSKSGFKNLSKPRIFRLGKKLHVCQECARSFRKWFNEGRVKTDAN